MKKTNFSALTTSGPLAELERIRPEVLKNVVATTKDGFTKPDINLLLEEALYFERLRIKRNLKPRLNNIFTYFRNLRDRKLWKKIRLELLKNPNQEKMSVLLHDVLSHYAEEIGGHFNPKVYRFATYTVPLGFSWLLNAASVQHYLPWKMTESLQSRLKIYGNISQLQRLIQKGTVLLVPTHQSNIDSLVIGYVIYLMSLPPFAYGAGLNLFSNPFFSYFMGHLGAYTVDREKTSILYKETLKNYSTQILKQGVHSIFFPGGGRSRNGAIESKLKLGLLGTGLQAQIQNLKENKPNPNIYIVPMVLSYHFVLEASSLIEDYLIQQGKHRFIGTAGEEPIFFIKVMNFFWKLFSSNSDVIVRVGKALDVFGNFVDEGGSSISEQGSPIETKKLLMLNGEIQPNPLRDREYTQTLGNKIVERYYKENTVLSSHLIAFALFSTIRKKNPDLDLFKFLRISFIQRTVSWESFIKELYLLHEKVLRLSKTGKLCLSPELETQNIENWVDNGMALLGYMHDAKVVKRNQDHISTEDMNLLFYYQNRLSGYGLSELPEIPSDPS